MISDSAGVALGSLPVGPFLRSTAVRSGLREAGLIELLHAGLLRLPVNGVLVRAEAPDDLPARAAAARLVLPEGSAVCRVTRLTLATLPGSLNCVEL